MYSLTEGTSEFDCALNNPPPDTSRSLNISDVDLHGHSRYIKKKFKTNCPSRSSVKICLWLTEPLRPSSQQGVWTRGSRKGVSGGTCLAFPGTFLLAFRAIKGTPQGTSTPNAFSEMIFPNAFSEMPFPNAVNVWTKERDERSLHRVPSPCSQVRFKLIFTLV